jgi:hypothetical protein
MKEFCVVFTSTNNDAGCLVLRVGGVENADEAFAVVCKQIALDALRREQYAIYEVNGQAL